MTEPEKEARWFIEELRRLSLEQFDMPLDGASDAALHEAIGRHVIGHLDQRIRPLEIARLIDEGEILVRGVSEELEP